MIWKRAVSRGQGRFDDAAQVRKFVMDNDFPQTLAAARLIYFMRSSSIFDVYAALKGSISKPEMLYGLSNYPKKHLSFLPRQKNLWVDFGSGKCPSV